MVVDGPVTARSAYEAGTMQRARAAAITGAMVERLHAEKVPLPFTVGDIRKVSGVDSQTLPASASCRAPKLCPCSCAITCAAVSVAQLLSLSETASRSSQTWPT